MSKILALYTNYYVCRIIGHSSQIKVILHLHITILRDDIINHLTNPSHSIKINIYINVYQQPFYLSSRSISKQTSNPSRKSQYGMINGKHYLLFAMKSCLWQRFSPTSTTKWWYTIYISIEHARPFLVIHLIILANAPLTYIELRGWNK